MESQWRCFPKGFLLSEAAREVLLMPFRQVPSHGFGSPHFSAARTARRGDRGTYDPSPPSLLLQIILNIPPPNKHCKTN